MRPMLLLLVLSLLAAPVEAARFRPIAQTQCDEGRFVVEARPYQGNMAGTSRVALRYLYQGVSLAALRYEAYDHELDAYLLADRKRTVEFGLSTDRDDPELKYGYYDNGDTLYLPPERFTEAQFVSLAECLWYARKMLRIELESSKIKGRTAFGLMKTQASSGVNGIARLVYAPFPFLGVFGNRHRLILVERDGSIVIHGKPDPGGQFTRLVLGQVRNERGRMIAAVPEVVVFEGETLVLADELKRAEDLHGQRFGDLYRLELQTARP